MRIFVVFVVLLCVSTLNAQTLVNKTILEWSRQLRTCDTVGDVDIPLSGTYTVAYSHNDQQTNLGATDDGSPQYHGANNRGVASVNFFDASSTINDYDPSEVNITIRSTPYTIPAIPTYYHCQGIKVDFPSTKHHIIIGTPSIEYSNMMLVHHMLLMICPIELSPTDLEYAGPCYGDATNNFTGMPSNLSNCDQISILVAWAEGGGPVVLPPQAGFPVQGTVYYLLQIHYNNPQLITPTDSSGFNLTITPNLRQYDAACLEFARLIQSISVPPGNESFLVEAIADNQVFAGYTAAGNFPNPAYVFAGFLHAHLLGRAIRVLQYRNGVYLQDIDFNPNYDFNFQHTVVYTEPRIILPTDALKLQCFYNSTGKTTVTTGGLATTNEMCQVYLYYYPAPSDPLTSTFSYPILNNSSTNPEKVGTNYLWEEYGLTRDLGYNQATANDLPDPPTIVKNCTTTYSKSYTVGTAGTTYLPISSFNPNIYTNSLILDSDGIYKLYWTVTLGNGTDNGIISFAVEVETSGWVGFGISPQGGMIGSDVVIGWVDDASGTVSLLDRLATQHALPDIDASQDIFNIRGYKGLYPKSPPASLEIYYDVPAPPSPPSTPPTAPSPSGTPPAPISGNGSAASMVVLILPVLMAVGFLGIYNI